MAKCVWEPVTGVNARKLLIDRKGKDVITHDMAARRGFRYCTAPLIRNLATKMVNFKPRFLYPRGKTPLHPLNRRLGEPLRRCGRFGWAFLTLPAITTTIPRFPSPQRSSYTGAAILGPDAMQINVTILVFETKRGLQGLTS
jgi:hypothetical protein